MGLLTHKWPNKHLYLLGKQNNMGPLRTKYFQSYMRAVVPNKTNSGVRKSNLSIFLMLVTNGSEELWRESMSTLNEVLTTTSILYGPKNLEHNHTISDDHNHNHTMNASITKNDLIFRGRNVLEKCSLL